MAAVVIADIMWVLVAIITIKINFAGTIGCFLIHKFMVNFPAMIVNPFTPRNALVDPVLSKRILQGWTVE